MTRNDIKKIIGGEAAPETIDALLDAFHGELTAAHEEADALKAELEAAGEREAEAEKTIRGLEKAAQNNEAAISEIEGYKTRIKELEDARVLDKITFAATDAFRAAGAHNPEKAVEKFFEPEGVKAGKDGSYAGIAEQVEALKKSDPYLFKAEAPTGPQGYEPRKAGEPRHDDLGKRMAAEFMRMNSGPSFNTEA